jgi:hypothetical protein
VLQKLKIAKIPRESKAKSKPLSSLTVSSLSKKEKKLVLRFTIGFNGQSRDSDKGGLLISPAFTRQLQEEASRRIRQEM